MSKPQLVPYELLSPGYEAVYTGRTSDYQEEIDAPGFVLSRGKEDREIRTWSVWAFADEDRSFSEWNDEIRFLNTLQSELGPLSDDIRKVRMHIASLLPCDNGLPVAVDELLRSIGRGRLDCPPFRAGCWNPNVLWQERNTQTDHVRGMRAIHDIVASYLGGATRESLTTKYPFAKGFLSRAYAWLGPVDTLTEAQTLKLERFLIPFDLWTKMPVWREGLEPDGPALVQTTLRELEGDDGRGADIDEKLKELGVKPPKGMPHKHGICDCHHNTFRFFERWIYKIGTGEGSIPTRRPGAERERIGQLLFGYSLALDEWLMEKPMQFLLLDLGHADLGFDPKNEIVRVYGYLGEERTPVKRWLAGCLWYSITYNGIFLDPNYRVALGRAHQELVENAEALGVSIRDWMDSRLGKRSEYR